MKLNAKERKWVADIQALLDNCPGDRLGFYTIGDAAVTLYDRRKEDLIGEIQDVRGLDFCSAVTAAKAEIDGAGLFESLNFPANVHSTAG